MNEILTLDEGLLLWIQGLRSAALNGPMRFVTTLGNAGAVWIALAVVLLTFRRTRRAGAACALALMLGALVTNAAIKPLVQRTRPYETIDSLTLLVARATDYSFPSGHATSSWAAAWALFRMRKRWGASALMLAALISLSRLYVGIHYPSDVLCGTLIGLAAGEAAARIVHAQRLHKEGGRAHGQA